MILTGKRAHRMSDHMMKRKNGREIWKCNKTLPNKRDKSTLTQWEISLPMASTKRLENVRQEILLDEISNLNTTMTNFMISCRSRRSSKTNLINSGDRFKEKTRQVRLTQRKTL